MNYFIECGNEGRRGFIYTKVHSLSKVRQRIWNNLKKELHCWMLFLMLFLTFTMTRILILFIPYSLSILLPPHQYKELLFFIHCANPSTFFFCKVCHVATLLLKKIQFGQHFSIDHNNFTNSSIVKKICLLMW